MESENQETRGEHQGSEYRWRRDLRTKSWGTPTGGGEADEEEPRKETQSQRPLRKRESQESVTFWKAREESDLTLTCSAFSVFF